MESFNKLFFRFNNQPAIITKKEIITYSTLIDLIEIWKENLLSSKIRRGDVVFFSADYSPRAIAILCALIELNCIIALSSNRSKIQNFKLISIVNAQHLLVENEHGGIEIESLSTMESNHPLITQLENDKQSGIVIFTSGSTGESKACLHHTHRLLQPFGIFKKSYRTISFLLFDHVGGLNTLFRCLFNGGCLVLPDQRSPDEVASTIMFHKVEALITTPSFLNMMMLSEAIHRYDLNSLKIVNYGSEPMSENILHQLKTLLPSVQFKQSYGMSELGVIPSRSKSSDSLLVKLGSGDCKVRVVNGLLEVKVPTSMIGYLNAQTPITDDGWFKTGDAVEFDGEYFRILGRKSEQINVGGEKTYPSQIEEVLHTMKNVADVAVTSEKHPMLGSLVKAVIVLKHPEPEDLFRIRLRKFCETKLSRFQIPQKIIITNKINYGDRFKKMRREAL